MAADIDSRSTSVIELQPRHRTSHIGEDDQEQRNESSLPPVDGGKDAWLFLAAAWTVEALIWGFGFSFGVLQDYYTTEPPFAGQTNVAIIGTSMLGTMYILAPVTISFLRSYPHAARYATLFGFWTIGAIIALSSLCTTIPQLIGVQGFLFATVGCVAYCPYVIYLDEWFVRRKGMAFGVVWSAAGFGGVVLPLVLQALLDRGGFRVTMWVWGGILAASAWPLSVYVRPRLPIVTANSGSSNELGGGLPHRRKRSKFGFLLSGVFLTHQLGNIAQATGFFLPGIYLPTYAREKLGATGFQPALTVFCINIGATFGAVVMGTLTDKLAVGRCIAIAVAGTFLNVALVWGLGSSLGLLYVFCLLYGFFAGGWTSIWPGIMRQVASQNNRDTSRPATDPTMVFGWLAVGRGIGNIVSGPMSAPMLAAGTGWIGKTIGGYGSGYGGLIVYTAVSSLAGGGSLVWDLVKS